jgi:hypothetical protein
MNHPSIDDIADTTGWSKQDVQPRVPDARKAIVAFQAAPLANSGA